MTADEARGLVEAHGYAYHTPHHSRVWLLEVSACGRFVKVKRIALGSRARWTSIDRLSVCA